MSLTKSGARSRKEKAAMGRREAQRAVAQSARCPPGHEPRCGATRCPIPSDFTEGGKCRKPGRYRRENEKPCA